jgi:hypothetical protein
MMCRAGTWAVCWSPSNEHQLLTGDAAGEVRLWDIRRSGTRALLDMAVTQRPKPKAALATSAAAAAAASSGAGASSRAANGYGGSSSRRSSGMKASAAAAGAAGGGSAEEEVYDDPRFGVGVRHSSRATKPLAHEAPVTGECLLLLRQAHAPHALDAGLCSSATAS